MERVFIDTDVCIDLIAKREPHYKEAMAVFALSETGAIRASVSSLTFATMDYILHQHYQLNSKKALQSLRLIVDLLPLDAKAIDSGLASEFDDMEDAFQHFAALYGKQDVIITRNAADFNQSRLPVFTPEQFLALR
ncbi:MAG: PIN domain-containing protein [Chitinophagales bacterium]|nr:PIN domain-containing protein [Chitinophagales bacterium]